MAGNYLPAQAGLPFLVYEGTIQAMNLDELARVRFSDISPDRLKRLFKIYDQTVGGTATYRLDNNFPIDYYVAQLRELNNPGGILEWRFGSSISGDSKLILKRVGLDDDFPVVVYFSPNVDKFESLDAESLGEAFNIAVIGFLREEKLLAK